ncbi:flagellar basal body P-ring formation chaperone FlgA [Nitrosomonas ureae]|uniref:Flagella basal body P-ring formation protein FlgA n=1 Tax=Nitrosomonas ureae TaxID=44577 RepID=A0A1H5U369_9PROT|nr:flagellar basal body P-ring formation chaperone FlgA [Nitrosomonas ureae]SEF69460.1 flagella basal body P-ring formation protein FlgA [Nitrosomonas ureae]
MMRYSILILCPLVLSLASFTPALASRHKTTPPRQEISLINNAIENFVYSNTARIPGQVTVNIGQIDKHLALPECPQLDPFIPVGNRLWGKTSIGVRCNSGLATWTIYVQAEINVMANVLHTARPIASGQIITNEDIAPQNINLTQLPEGILTDASLIVGKVAATHLPAGQPLRPQMLRAPYVILRGQTVNLVAQGRGFNIQSEGQALADAADGQIIQVRNKSGRIISGLARPNSIVEIRP